MTEDRATETQIHRAAVQYFNLALDPDAYRRDRVRVEHGDCREVLKRLAAEGMLFDSCVTDPPYHLSSIVKRFMKTGGADRTASRVGAYTRHAKGFMGRTWDGGDIAFRADTWAEVLRVLKPGAYIVAFGGARTFHRMACAIEDAGFITHPLIGWIYGQGFPKAHKIKAEGYEGWRYGGQAMKPALEPIYLGQKPMEGTGTENVLKHGTGALHIDACRVFGDDEAAAREGETSQDRRYNHNGATDFAAKPGRRYRVKRLKPGATLERTGGNWRPEDGPIFEGELKDGRWPANVVHDGSPPVIVAFPETPGQIASSSSSSSSRKNQNCYGEMRRGNAEHVMHPRGDVGTAARFYFAAKASEDDRIGSKHPTVKPVSLMRWLVRLVTPPGGLVLDPFAGTGTTGAACIREGMRAFLIEREAEYVADIRRRLEIMRGGDTPLFRAAEPPPPLPDAPPMPTDFNPHEPIENLAEHFAECARMKVPAP